MLYLVSEEASYYYRDHNVQSDKQHAPNEFQNQGLIPRRILKLGLSQLSLISIRKVKIILF